MFAFDIETGPLADERLRELCPPFEPPAHPGEFDERAVKLGNLKDAAKIKEKIDAARQSHADAVSRYSADVAAAAAKHYAEFASRAALDATTGHVVAIGFIRGELKTPLLIDCDGDKELHGLRAFWGEIEDLQGSETQIVGFNVQHFDLPFLVRRSWILGVKIPTSIIRDGRYWSKRIVDLMQVWTFGGRDLIKLDKLAIALGLQGKCKEANGEQTSGADFHRLWRENRAAAETYLRRDVMLCVEIGQRLGVCCGDGAAEDVW